MSIPPFELENWFAEAEGHYDLSLSHSDCEPPCWADFLDEQDLRQFAETPCGYGDFAGIKAFRQLVAANYETLEADDILTFNGPSEAIYTFMRSSLQAGDEVITPAPAFHTLSAIAQHIGCRLKRWEPRSDFRFDVADLEQLCSDSTKLIVINFPHNPSGQTIAADELREVARLAESVGAVLFSDECFRLLEIPPRETLPAACDLYDRAVSVTGISKPFGMGGARLGWLATRCDSIREAAQQYRFYTTEVTSTPSQLLASHVLGKQDPILTRNRQVIVDNLSLLRQFVERHSPTLQLIPPQAGTMALVQQDSPYDSSEFCRRLLEQHRVFLVPGRPLGISDKFLRFGLGRRDFAQSLSRLESFMGSMKSQL